MLKNKTGWNIEDSGLLIYRIEDIYRGGVFSMAAYGYGLMMGYAVEYADGKVKTIDLTGPVKLSEAVKAVEEHHFH